MNERVQLDDWDRWWSIVDASTARLEAAIVEVGVAMAGFPWRAQSVVLAAAMQRALLVHFPVSLWPYPENWLMIDPLHRRAVAGIVTAAWRSAAGETGSWEGVNDLVAAVPEPAIEMTSNYWARVFEMGRRLANGSTTDPEAAMELTSVVPEALSSAVGWAIDPARGRAMPEQGAFRLALKVTNPGDAIVVGWFRRDVEEVGALWPEVDLVGLRLRARHDAVALARMCRRLEALEFPPNGPIDPSPWEELGWHDRGLRPGDPDAPPV